MEQRFTDVYRTGEWSNNREYPLSGRGSTLEHTAQVRENLTHIITTLFDKRKVLRIIDAPCGDMTWMPVWLNEIVSGGWKIHYQGIDVVKPIMPSQFLAHDLPSMIPFLTTQHRFAHAYTPQDFWI